MRPPPQPARSAQPLLAAGEVLLAVVLICSGLWIQSALFTFGSAPWMALVAALFLWWRRAGPSELGLGRPSSIAGTVIIGLLVGVGYQGFGTFVLEPMISRLITGELPDVSGFRPLIGDTRGLTIWLIYAWVLAAFFEEVAYRGWLLTRMAEIGRWSNGAWAAASVASSVLFGAVHAYQGTSGMIATGLSGLVFALVFLLTKRSLWAAIIAHGVLDTIGFVMIYLGIYPGL